MPKITLNDLLGIKQGDYPNIRVRFNQGEGTQDPMDLYLQNPDIINVDWFLWRKDQKKFFTVGQVAICLLKLSYDTWLLTTIKRITKDLNVTNGINYDAEEVEEYRKYFGRVILTYHKTHQTQVRKYGGICDDLEVLEILPALFDGDEFPGYDRVRLSYAQLHSIIIRQKKSWISALKNQKAVYLITDKHAGKLYVGSATSDSGMLLAWWTSYVNNGHGGNVELKDLVSKKGFDYVKENFQYSILENYNARVDDHIIFERESWWKETLQSRAFGYNSN